jgi:orotate phosphoribosyltransferase
MMSKGRIESSELASRLLEIGAVLFSPDDPFTWASGLRSPVYCDNRMTLGYPDLRTSIAHAFATLSRPYAPDRIAGTATAGIPHAAWLAQRLDLPMCYVRSKSKAHGRSKMIEGPLARGDRVVLVEDLVSTGMSSLAAVRALQEEGATVPVVLALFSYGLAKARESFADAGLALHTVTTFPALLEAASESGRLDAAGVSSLERWYGDPAAWSEAVKDAGA